MRGVLAWGIVLLAASVSLAGCGSGGDDDEGDTIIGKGTPTSPTAARPTPTSTTPRPTPTQPAQTPNSPPELVVKVTDGSGNETSVTVAGGNLTFDASGTTDPDGNLAYIAMVVKDANGTLSTPAVLFNANVGGFAPATLPVAAAGLANLTVVAYDARGAFDVLFGNLYANLEVRALDDHVFALGAPAGASAADCAAPTTDLGLPVDPAGDQVFAKVPFAIPANVTFAEVVLAVGPGSEAGTLGDAEAALCLAGTAVEPEAETPGVYPAPAAGAYELAVLSKRPNTRVTATVVLHFEPR